MLFALVLIYVAIMAIRLSRIERELGELLRARERPPARPPASRADLAVGGHTARSRATRRRDGPLGAPSSGVDAGMSELLALGISHKTAPVALRERLAFTERRGGRVRRSG